MFLKADRSTWGRNKIFYLNRFTRNKQNHRNKKWKATNQKEKKNPKKQTTSLRVWYFYSELTSLWNSIHICRKITYKIVWYTFSLDQYTSMFSTELVQNSKFNDYWPWALLHWRFQHLSYKSDKSFNSIDLSNHLRSLANWLMLAGIPFISEADIFKINF